MAPLLANRLSLSFEETNRKGGVEQDVNVHGTNLLKSSRESMDFTSGSYALNGDHKGVSRSVSAPPAPNSRHSSQQEQGHKMMDDDDSSPHVSGALIMSLLQQEASLRSHCQKNNGNEMMMSSSRSNSSPSGTQVAVCSFERKIAPSFYLSATASSTTTLAEPEATAYGHEDTPKGALDVREGGGSSTQQQVTVIRPNPIKTLPPRACTLLAAPKARTATFGFSPELQENKPQKAEQPWCKQASDRSQEEIIRKQKEEQAKRRLEERKRLEALQCDFPCATDFDNDTVMPPTSGRVPVAEADDAHDNNMHENSPQPNRSHNNRAGVTAHRTPRSAARKTAEVDNEDGNNNTPSMPPTPLFERLVTEEVQEIKAYARIIENQNRRLAELERAHGDLESRLQVESKSRQNLEATLESREAEWANQLQQLEIERNELRDQVRLEENKNKRLMDEIIRKEQEIQKMLQRKYNNEGSVRMSVRNMRGPAASHTPPDRVDNRGTPPSGASRSPELTRTTNFQSPHDILKASGSAQDARLRNSGNLLADFFGI